MEKETLKQQDSIHIMKSKEIKIGITVVLALVFVYVGITFLKGLKLTSSDNVYYVEMENVGGLAKSGEVIANGMNIGLVKDITYDARRQTLAVAVELNDGFTLPKNSYANISKDMLGSPKLNIVLGKNPDDLLAKGDTILGEGTGDLMSSVGQLIPQLSVMIPKIDSILTAINALTNDPALLASVRNLETVTANLKTTTESVNSMLGTDIPQLVHKANNICSNLETTTGQLSRVDIAGIAANANSTLRAANSTMEELHLFTNRLNNPNGSLGRLLNDESLYSHLDSTVVNASLLLEDLRLNPRRYVHFSVFGGKKK